MRLRSDWGWMALLFGVALAVRWPLAQAAPYGDEAVHFAAARTLGFLDDSVFWDGPDITFRLYPLVVGRPLFTLLHLPGVLGGFEGYRAFGLALSALIPPALFATVRGFGGRPGAGVAAGAAAAFLPTFVVWGARIFPDSSMTLLVLIGLWAFATGRRTTAWILLLAACWVKESAAAALFGLVAYVCVESIWQRSRKGVALLAAMRPTRAHALPLAAGALAFVPTAAAYALVPMLPGWVMGGSPLTALDALVVSAFFLVPMVGLLALRQGRPLSVVALSVVAFYLVYSGVRGGFIQGWYAILPAALALACAALAVDFGLRSDHWPRLAALCCAGLLASVCVIQVVGVGPEGSALVHPLRASSEPGLGASLAYVAGENRHLADAIAFQQSTDPGIVLELDLPWYWIVYPFEGRDHTVFAFTEFYPQGRADVDELGRWIEASDLVWVYDAGHPFGDAFRQTYADCLRFEAGPLAAFAGQACIGRIEELRQQYEFRRDATA